MIYFLFAVVILITILYLVHNHKKHDKLIIKLGIPTVKVESAPKQPNKTLKAPKKTKRKGR